MSTVAHIFVAATRGAPMSSKISVEALQGIGLSGDRYTNKKNRRTPDYQVTLIELENIEAFRQLTGLRMSPEMPRRNIVTTGTRLNDFLRERFAIGGAMFEGLELCEPCGLLAKRTYRDILAFFRGKGGLRARVLSGGTISVGDAISWMPNGALLTDTYTSPLRAQRG